VPESTCQFVGNVVIAGNQQHGHAQAIEQQLDGAVSNGIVLHDVARDGDGVDREKMPLGMLEAGPQAGQGRGAAQFSCGVRQ
jgi:hypothetical protein